VAAERVLVTGAGGYLGASVARHLAEAGHQVLGLVRRVPGDPPVAGVRHVLGDVLDAGRLAAVVRDERVTAVCHLAARAHAGESWRDPLGYYTTNVQGTVNVLACRPARLVFASTCAVYQVRGDAPAREDDPLDPVSPYAAAKRAAEEVIGFQAAAGGLGAVTLRCVNVAGADGGPDPNPDRLVPRALLAATGRVARLTVPGDGSAVREFVHVADVARAFVLALAGCRDGVHEVFNVGSGCGVTILAVLAAAAEVTSGSIDVEYGPATEPPVLLADSSRIGARLGWRPRRSAIREILADTLSAGLPGHLGGRARPPL
jgi:UDP-glucose 4-epimerase